MITIAEIEKDLGKKKVTKFKPGDTVDVHVKIKEGDKERVQVFSGMVIARQHGGHKETFTVRRIVQGEGVERIFPLHSPNVVKIAVKKRGHVRRAKLYYLRGRVGKAAKLKRETQELVVPGYEEIVPPEAKAEEKIEPKAKVEAKAESKAKVEVKAESKPKVEAKPKAEDRAKTESKAKVEPKS